MSIIKEAHDDIIDRLGFGLPDETSEAIRQWLRRTYVLGALDERKKHEYVRREMAELKKTLAQQIREINALRRHISMHGLE